MFSSKYGLAPGNSFIYFLIIASKFKSPALISALVNQQNTSQQLHRRFLTKTDELTQGEMALSDMPCSPYSLQSKLESLVFNFSTFPREQTQMQSSAREWWCVSWLQVFRTLLNLARKCSSYEASVSHLTADLQQMITSISYSKNQSTSCGA